METHLKSIGTDGKIVSERRSGVRRRVLKGAVMIFNKGYSTFECVVRNESDGGARLSLAETFALPKTFTLTIMAEEEGRVVDIVWRSASEIGVRYRDMSDGPLQAA
ncbi:MAG TPA: PilZ domain-containing protein [Rhizobiaceae bacterium]|nr:PilZ domain-containing protein [Rhizobiaceae bacterium]